MLNQIVLVGRLTRDIVVNKADSGSKVATISLAIPRSFKNSDGTYDTDFIDCTAFDLVAENTAEYCFKGDIVGVKGRVQSRVIEKEDHKETIMEIICEKVTFLSSHSKEGEEEK
ncbi:MAG: single-stranded DNA-binding protein [Bacilli bacterium]|nr:single-stranded DNA-binding protein [Bacilli bacterium]